MQTHGATPANAPADKMLQPPQSTPNSRPLSIMTTATSATAQDKTGETWKMHVTEENCWEDLILTLGTYYCFCDTVSLGACGMVDGKMTAGAQCMVQLPGTIAGYRWHRLRSI
jgi:hypothetical protein